MLKKRLELLAGVRITGVRYSVVFTMFEGIKNSYLAQKQLTQYHHNITEFELVEPVLFLSLLSKGGGCLSTLSTPPGYAPV